MKNNLANAVRILQALKELADVSHLSPAKPICGVALAILDYIQTLRKLREDHAGLANRVVDLTRIVVLETRGVEGRLSPELRRRVDTLERALVEILDDLQKDNRLQWYQRLQRTQELKDNLLAYNTKLDDCRMQFTVGSLLGIQNFLDTNIPTVLSDIREIRNSSSLITSDMSNLMCTSATMRGECQDGFRNVIAHLDSGSGHQDNPLQAYRYDQIKLIRSLYTVSDATFHRAEVKIALEPTRVVVKMFNSNSKSLKAFQRDVDVWLSLHHPNLHRLLGLSVPSAKVPFLLLSDYGSDDVFDFVGKQLRKTEVDSFMSTLSVLQGIASGIDYLRLNCPSITKSELERSFQLSNIVTTSEGQPVVGHNLVNESPSFTSASNTLPKTMDSWLRKQFLQLFNTLTYEKLDLSNWDVVMAKRKDRYTSHLRVLEHFTSYVVPSFTTIANELSKLVDRLEDRYSRNELHFPDIRRTILGLRGGAFVYRPPTPIECSLADVGYMKDGTFHFLENVEILRRGAMEFPALFLCSTGGFEEGISDGSGLLRHRFTNTLYATIRRYTSNKYHLNVSHAWDYLLSHGQEICERHSTDDLALQIQDLIQITAVENDLRYCALENNSDCTSCDYEFVEYEDPQANKPWGYWIVEDGRDVTFTATRYVQNLNFVQLEKADIM